MAPIDISSPPSLLAAVPIISHGIIAVYLTSLVGRTAYRSYLTLPPSSATRLRERLRKEHVHVFASLALISLSVASFYSFSFASLSHRIWADERGVEVPQSFFGENGVFRGGNKPVKLHLLRWLSNSALYQDFHETVAEKARYFWWGQQISLATVSWSNFVAVEGQRRNVTHLWAFMALAQLVNLSFAQNLFFITLLLTPVPLPENVKDLTKASIPLTSSRYTRFVDKVLLKKPVGWVPKPALSIAILLSTYMSVFLLPFATNTPSFMSVTLLSKSLPFLPLILPSIAPENWGTIQEHPHEAYSTYATILRTISAVSALLHFKATASALFYNTPDSHYHRHILLRPFKEEHRSALNRGSTAVGKLFGAINEQPAISAVGWDVLLSGISVGIWAGVRGLDAKAMLQSSVPFLDQTEKLVDETAVAVKSESKEAIEKIQGPVKKRAGRPRKVAGEPSTPSAATKRRGRSGKETDDDDDAAYQPSDDDQVIEGDDTAESDVEMAALAWGLIIAGGLASGSTGVYGAEMMAR